MAERLNPNFTYLQETVPKQRWVNLQGGTRSGKTRAIIDYIIKLCKDCKNHNLEIDIVRSTYSALRATAWKDFEDVLKEYGIYNEADHHKTEHIYRLFGNNINYYGADDPQKVHGRKRTILWLNEAHQFEEETIMQLTPRTKKRIIADYNPAIGDLHWIDKYIEKYPPFITTYRDNPFLTPEQVEDIEDKKDQPYWWAVYGTGQRAKREGVIFDYEIGDFDDSLPFYYGLDFGYVNDPDACVKVAIDEKRRILYCQEVFYEYGQKIDELALTIQGIPKAQMVADSAEARLIDHLRSRANRQIMPVKKGAGSVLNGIRIMENYKIIITKGSTNLKTELNNYSWSDKGKEAPIDDWNHLIDAVRYVVTTYSNRGNIKQPRLNEVHNKFIRGEDTGANATPW